MEGERDISVYYPSVLVPFTEVFRGFYWTYPRMVYVTGFCETWVHFYQTVGHDVSKDKSSFPLPWKPQDFYLTLILVSFPSKYSV
jgi:hypothetical protein